MEEDIFRRPAVGGLLREKFVEARLHNDHQDERIKSAVQKLQDELAGSRATPIYLIYDPRKRTILQRFEGPDLLSGGRKFAEFLNKALH
jgi:hypothetical protein